MANKNEKIYACGYTALCAERDRADGMYKQDRELRELTDFAKYFMEHEAEGDISKESLSSGASKSFPDIEIKRYDEKGKIVSRTLLSEKVENKDKEHQEISPQIKSVYLRSKKQNG